ncbi:sodium-dependent glucose transporter 1C-like [Tropilaelaps mercedesae]|uniref:Sodium-dependent glucose transporter 1C-like n=1 Tax=Tropilaelaps mercedesae TaxID=418985 RepID=A0A1V9XEY4_9ACAR|nr:sodium-dependent glucose transporter 1C-like [Tropilaelaps mercedesae]
MDLHTVKEAENGDFTINNISCNVQKSNAEQRLENVVLVPDVLPAENPPVSSRVRWFHTANIFAALFALGMVSAVTGTTFDDLAYIFDENVEVVSRIIISKNVGAFLSAIACGGLIFQIMNARSVMLWTMIAGGLGTALAPLIPELWMVHVGMFVTGVSSGVFECGANVWLVHLWGKSIGPILQIYNLMFGLGALVAPPLTAPFLGHNITEHTTHNATIFTSTIDTDYLEASSNGSNYLTKVWIPYMVFGGTYTAVGLLLIVGFILDTTKLDRVLKGDTAACKANRPMSYRFHWSLVTVTTCYVLFTVCIEATMGQMLFLYAENPSISLRGRQPLDLVTIFWGTYTVGRLISTFASLVVNPCVIVVISQSMLSVGCGVFFLLVLNPASSSWAIWLGTAMTGAGVSPLYGSACAWAFQYFHLRFVEMALILTAACIGQSVPIYLVAPLVQSSPGFFPVVLAAEAVLLLIFLFLIFFWTKGAVRMQ